MEKLFVEEKMYQQMKKEMCKSDDYFTIKELNQITTKLRQT